MSHKAIHIAVVTDGRPGNVVQAEGLAQALLRLRAGDMALHDVKVNPVWRALSLHLPGGGIGALPQMVGKADLVIGAGRRGNIVAAQARRHGAKAIGILSPPGPARWYDLVIVPEHDTLDAPNVLSTLGSMNTLTSERMTQAAAGLAPLPRVRIVILIGGPSRSAAFTPEPLIADIARFAGAGYSLHATASRRTPQAVLDRLNARFPDMSVWTGEPPNPYPGWLHHANAILVTRDSVNMASEAAATGLPLYISDTGPVAAKFEHFHDALRARGITRPAADGPAQWHYSPLREADRIAPTVLDRLAL